MITKKEYGYFVPRRMASWWCTLEDILWPEKKIADKIRRRAEGFAKANIDTAINFGFHARFDFSNYFGQLHGYYANVCDELHRYGIKFMDHYSCNIVERPRNEEEYRKLHASHRHHILLHHDPAAAEYAQYAGTRFQDICEADVRDGSRGYSWNYQTELFCHNNPAFREMHSKYLKRLLSEVPVDGFQIDDMCDYGFLATCGCEYCRDRFRRDYGYEIPPFEDKGFWGDTSGGSYSWGNYENEAFRAWLQMKTDSTAEHVKMIKGLVDDKPLMTCCSSTGPMILNAVALDLEKMVGSLDLLMLENCGFSVDSVNWCRMDAEALQQKDIAEKMGHVPTIALSYTIFEKGGYLGWCLSRFWGVGNWSSTLTGRLADEPVNAMEIHEIIEPVYNWEKNNSDLDYMNGTDIAEVRLASNRLCRINGWRDDEGLEHWDRVSEWSEVLLEHNLGYRFVRSDELSDADLLNEENTPVILDGLGCVSDEQFMAIKKYLENGGKAWLKLPFGTHDGKGNKRSIPLSEELMSENYENLLFLGSESRTQALERFIEEGYIVPRIRQVSGDKRWTARLRLHPEGTVLHLLNRALEAVPHPELVSSEGGNKVLLDIKSSVTDNMPEFVLDFNGVGKPWESAAAASPEIGSDRRAVKIERLSGTEIKVKIDLAGIDIYAVVQ